MAYGALLAAARAQDPGTLGRYEPFLWGAPTWDKLPGDIGDAFSHTDSINARGVYAHSESPLFRDDAHPALDSFIDETLPAGRPVVAKVIRGAGRLSAFLERDPDLRIVHLIRNPLDLSIPRPSTSLSSGASFIVPMSRASTRRPQPVSGICTVLHSN
jgi:hypothetical protein